MAGTLQALVAAAASQHSDRTAVTYDRGGPEGSAEPSSLSYSDLALLAAELSGILQRTCSPRRSVIGLCCSDDLLVPVWILGILQSSAAYVPLDPDAPGRLSAGVMSHCGLKFCAVKSDIVKQFCAALVKFINVEVCVELPKFRLTLMQIHPLPVEGGESEAPAPDSELDLAYVMHTSGTTGPPKTVRVPHRCILPNILHLRSLFQMSAEDVVFLASPLTFDPSVVDIFLALSSGARLLVVPAILKKMPNRLARVLFRDHKATVLQVTPSLLMRFGHRVLKQDVLSSSSSLRVLALGGETCPSPTLLRSWRHEDNKTSIYNIYGVTEVSCWACCYRIPDTLAEPSVPLGAPLMDTLVEVRDEDGHVVTQGQGQVFIGGRDRVCLLDGEDTVVPGAMRATGDWADVREGHLYYLGRKDRMIKRHGKRVNLDSLQQLILSLPQVDACAVCVHKGFQLLAFIAASSASTVSSEQRSPCSAAEAGSDLKRRLMKQLSLLVPSHSLPDALVLVPVLPVTAHGKVNMKALTRGYETHRSSLQGDTSKLIPTLQNLWRETLGLPRDASIDEQSNFLFSGGDSLKALRLCEDLAAALRASSTELLQVVLEGAFSDVLQHLMLLLPGTDTSSSPPATNKRPAEPLNVIRAKRGHQRSFKVVRRAGGGMDMSMRDRGQKQIPPEEELRGKDIFLSLSWSSDTGRCVDASVVLLIRDRDHHRSTLAFVGSHSHRMQALDVGTGNLLWERVLGDRIESSAAVSHCGALVIVGCYDGCVYFLCAESGETRWLFKTGDAVKSSPTVDPLTGLVVVGSHDGHVYALDPQVQQCVWKRHCGGGAVFSSPHVHVSHRQLYVASLGGRLLCLDMNDGRVLWSHCGDKPFFSSPNCSGERVVIGSVDGNICCFSTTGELLWQFLTLAPVFSSPCFIPEQQRLVCGSHDGHLYCLNSTDGSLIWTFQTTGRVYASPYVFDGASFGRRGTLVGIASTDGNIWILDAEDGRAVASHSLPGEVFSSPVVWDRFLVIGCRDDFVYCLNLSVKE